MLKKIALLIGILLVFQTITSFAQQFQSTTYNVDKGLPTDLAKCVAEDNLGFLWVGTDDGIFRYDGKNAILFNSILPSNYIKSFIKLSDGRLFVVHDMGITEIISKPDTSLFRPVISGIASITKTSDSTVNYPKTCYEDSKKRLWISEFGQITCIENKKKYRYPFSTENHTTNFARSFSIAEDGYGNIWATAFTGNLFVFRNKEKRFEQVPLKFALKSIPAMINYGKGQILIGSATGMFLITVSSTAELLDCKQIGTLTQISSFAKAKNGNIYVGTWDKGLHILSYQNNEFQTFAVNAIPQAAINYLLFNEATGVLWVCTDDGLNLLQTTFFEAIKIAADPKVSGVTHYIESMAQAPDGTIYLTTSASLMKVTQENDEWVARSLLTMPNGFFARVETDANGLWLGDSFGEIHYYNLKTNKLTTIPESKAGKFTYHLTRDADGNIWSCHDEFIGVNKITPEFQITHYQKDRKLNTQVNVIRVARNGKVYVGGFTDSTYLYVYEPSADVFLNLSAPLSFKEDKPFYVDDIAIDYSDTIWLATTYGLLKYYDNKISRMDLGPTYTREAVKAITVSNEYGIWLANSFGIIRLQNGNSFLFDKASGLPANTVIRRNILIDKQNRLWVATAKGATFSSYLHETFKITPKPIFLYVKINGKKTEITPNKSLSLPYHAYVEVEYVSLSYPNDKVKYEYRLKGKDTAWSAPSDKQGFLLPRLSSGKYELHIRAQQHSSNYKWSEPLVLEFTIRSPWYSSWWAIILYVLSFMLLVYGLVRFYTWRLTQEHDRLDALVKERTEQVNRQKDEMKAQAEYLSKANEEIMKQKSHLEELNAEKNNLMSFVAHDLRTPLNSVNSLLEIMESEGELNGEQKKVQKQIYKVLEGGRRLIQNLLDLNAVDQNRSKTNMEAIELDDFILGFLSNYKKTASKKDIKFHFQEKECPTLLYTDKDYLRRILDNLVTNAIKFSPFGKSIFVELIDDETNISIIVCDEGPGFTEDDMQKVFKRFQKLSAQPTAGETSTGLGLSIIKTLVERLGGEITLDSKPGEGSKFTIKFDKVVE